MIRATPAATPGSTTCVQWLVPGAGIRSAFAVASVIDTIGSAVHSRPPAAITP